jgi:hypothetical protein
MYPGVSSAQRDCVACNIVQEYGIQSIRPGSTYRNFDGSAITIVQIDYGSRQALVYPAGYPNARRAWIPAENIYTDQRVFERQQTVGLNAACALYRNARDEGSVVGVMLLRGACCNSSAAARYGAPRDLC